jgi:hypothetical protein
LIWDEGTIDIQVEQKVFKVNFKRQNRTGEDDPLPKVGLVGGIIAAENLESRYDRLGRVAYIIVTIYFPMYCGDAPEKIDDFVYKVINRLLDVYRYATGEFHVGHVPRGELGGFAIGATRDDGTLENREIMTTGSAGVIRDPEDVWLTAPRKVPISPEARQMLQEGINPPIPEMFLMNAKREDLFENHRIAVVEAQTAFEALVDRVLTEYYRWEGVPEEEIDRKLGTSLINLIHDHLPNCRDEPFEETMEYESWKSNLYELRIDVVHDPSVSAAPAKEALEAAEKVFSWLRNHSGVT